MTPLAAAGLLGNWATLMLPLNDDDSVDFGLLEAELDYVAAARVNGIYSNGSAGEFHTQNEAEFDRISALLADKSDRSGTPFQIGACHVSPQLSRERIRRTKALRPGAYQIILPDWFPPTLDEIIAFLEVIAAEADPIPLVLYNPGHAKRRLLPAEWKIVVERIPAIVGMKVSGGDEAWYTAMAPVMNQVSVFIPGHTLATGLSRGARGAYSNVACLSPIGAQRWYDLCRENPAAGQAVEKKIQTFWGASVAPLITELKLPNMAADKATAVAGGWLPGFSPRLRWPYRSASLERCAAIRLAARRDLPEFFD